MRAQLGRDDTNVALWGKVSFAQRVISKGYVWQKITYDNFCVMNLTTTFDPQQQNQCIRIAENPAAAKVLFRDRVAQGVTAYPTALSI
jgi:hypothetical protein